MTTVLTVGHGTRSTEELVATLRAAGVCRLVDVRRFPGSRRHPHFSREALERSLHERGIAYEWWGEELGGRRPPRSGPASRHSALINKAFQGYADHMDTSAFRDTLARLEAHAQSEPPLAIMCAETLWWRCHRRMIADALAMHGVTVVHLIDPRSRQDHRLHPATRADDDDRPVYDVGSTGKLAL